MSSSTNAHGSFYSTRQQIIGKNDLIKFENQNNILNLNLEDNHINILITGTYLIHFIGQINEECQIALFVNDISELLFCNNNCFTIHNIYKLKNGDKISLRNLISYGVISTKQGMFPDSKNIELTIHKIN